MSLLLGLMNRGEYSQSIEDELDQLVAAIQTAFNRVESNSGSAGDWTVNGDLFVVGNIGLGTTTNLGARLTIAKSTNAIAVDTMNGDDDGYLSVAGGGADGSPRGAHLYLSGNERATVGGDAVLAAGNVSTGHIKFRTGADVERLRISATGLVTIASTDASALDVAGGAQFGSGDVALIGTDGRINGPLSSTIIDDLSGANLTNLPAANLLIALQAVGDLLYASSTTVWARLAVGGVGTFLQGGTTPSWATIPAISSTYFANLSGANLTGLPAANLTGTIASAVQDLITRTGTLVAGATGVGFTVALDSSTITGTLADARLSSNVALKNIDNSFSADQTISKANALFVIKATTGGENGKLQIFDNDSDGWELADVATVSNQFRFATVNNGTASTVVMTLHWGTDGAGGGVSIGDTTDPGATNVRVAGTSALVGAVTISAEDSGNITWGTYTPTLTNVANLDGSTAFAAQYLRVGNTVTVSGKVDVDPTLAAPTYTQLGMSLPVASNFAQVYQCGGTGKDGGSTFTEAAAISAAVANDRAEFTFMAQSTASHSIFFSFTYQVI